MVSSPTAIGRLYPDNDARVAEAEKTFMSLGYGKPICVSAAHGTGIDDIVEAVQKDSVKLGFKPPTVGTFI